MTAELAWDPAVNSTAINVAVKNSVVTLSGHLETFTDKHAAERALRRVTGVKVIALELDVKLSSNHQRSNIDVAAVAEEALRWNTGVPPDKTQL